MPDSFSHLAGTTPYPIGLEVASAKGCYVTDTEGGTYLDLIGGVAVANTGHRHPKVIRAIQGQLDRHLHVMVYGEYVQQAQERLAKNLSEYLPPGLDTSFFVNSGTEAVEGAMKLAKKITGRTDLAGFMGSYHGGTHGSLSVSGTTSLRPAALPLLPGIDHLTFNDPDELHRITERTAGVLVEIVQGDAGIRPASDKFLKALAKRCEDTGALLILDEIQTGFGRTGPFFAFEDSPITPDILLLAKGMGGGMPIGAFISSKEHMEVLERDPILGHLTTFGGHPVSCAAALGNLEALEEVWDAETVREKERVFRQELIHPAIKEIRGKGLMLAVELESVDACRRVVAFCREKGLLLFWFISAAHCLRIAPPLTITTKEIRWSCATILAALDEEDRMGQRP